MNHLRALDPIYPHLLEGPPPLDARANLHYLSSHHRVLALMIMAMEEQSSAAITLTHFEQNASYDARLSLAHSPKLVLRS
jgi:hypothetical protein